jgi:hypothetical protein
MQCVLQSLPISEKCCWHRCKRRSIQNFSSPKRSSRLLNMSLMKTKSPSLGNYMPAVKFHFATLWSMKTNSRKEILTSRWKLILSIRRSKRSCLLHRRTWLMRQSLSFIILEWCRSKSKRKRWTRSQYELNRLV